MKLPRRGILLAIEGIDGAGKTTLVAFLEQALTRLGLEVVRTKEPTERTAAGRLIRSSAATHRLPLEEELQAFVDDRRAHVETLIGPALADGKVVIVDRYYFSTIAYQGARGADIQYVQELNQAFAPRPDLLFILDIDTRIGLARVRVRGEVSAFEREDELDAAGAIFATMHGDDVVHIDATRTPEQIQEDVLRAVINGPLRSRFCSDGIDPPCDMTWCVRQRECMWPALLTALPPIGAFRDKAIAIASDTTLAPTQRVAAILEAARGEG